MNIFNYLRLLVLTSAVTLDNADFETEGIVLLNKNCEFNLILNLNKVYIFSTTKKKYTKSYRRVPASFWVAGEHKVTFRPGQENFINAFWNVKKKSNTRCPFV